LGCVSARRTRSAPVYPDAPSTAMRIFCDMARGLADMPGGFQR
jgi:hypothetical protein